MNLETENSYLLVIFLENHKTTYSTRILSPQKGSVIQIELEISKIIRSKYHIIMILNSKKKTSELFDLTKMSIA